jgi:Ion transport protein
MTTATATVSDARPAEGRTASVGVSAAAHRFEHAVTAVILANSAVMLWSLIDHSREELLENVDLAFLSFFGTELLVRLAKARLGFFRSPWRCADAAIIVLALLPVLGGGVAVLRMARLAKLAHLGRHVNHLRGITALRLPVRILQRRSAPTVALPPGRV